MLSVSLVCFTEPPASFVWDPLGLAFFNHLLRLQSLQIQLAGGSAHPWFSYLPQAHSFCRVIRSPSAMAPAAPLTEHQHTIDLHQAMPSSTKIRRNSSMKSRLPIPTSVLSLFFLEKGEDTLSHQRSSGSYLIWHKRASKLDSYYFPSLSLFKS